ncbi:MAG: hypothetical protein ACP59X_04990 [Solidesulfovibrio sp. DCME]|uniref:hypothetical protein n=1 Tax=Solidesulfovibrio sp. DCME TaxID=3447380 RepID=UPI003D0DFB2A
MNKKDLINILLKTASPSVVNFLKGIQTHFLSDKTLHFTMLGGRGVGKTSLLACMYNQLTNANALLAGQVRRVEGVNDLDNAYSELRRMCNRQETQVYNKYGVTGTEELKVYSFNLGKKPSHLSINFYDFPGGWVVKDENRDKLETLCKISDAILVAVDMPFVMEDHATHATMYNKPEVVKEIIQAGLEDSCNNKLVLLVPTRGEKYYLDSMPKINPISAIEETYGSLINMLKGNGYSKRTTLAITPVLTTGCVVFSRFKYEENDSVSEIYFRKISPNAVFTPKNCEQPLYYLLDFFLKKRLEEKSMFDKFLSLFIGDSLAEVREEIRKNTKTSGEGFKMLIE